jgi:hypothetical protein
MKLQIIRFNPSLDPFYDEKDSDLFHLEEKGKWMLFIHFHTLRFWSWTLGFSSMEARTSNIYWIDFPSFSVTLRVRKAPLAKN